MKSKPLWLAIVFLAYLLTAKFGLTLGAVSGFATLVWPPTGIALVSLLLLGFELWPAIALGALLANYWTGAPLAVAAGIAAGNTLEAIVGATLFRRTTHGRISLERSKDVAALVVLVAGLSTTVSATIGVTSLYWGGMLAREGVFATWRAWWIGDAISNLLIAPLFLVWSRLPRFRLEPSRAVEGLALVISILAVCALIFGSELEPEVGRHVFPYLVFPMLIWTTLRFGQHANTCFALAVCAVAVAGTVQGRGPFQADSLPDSLLGLQLFIAAVSITGLFFGALGREKEKALALRDEFISIASHELKTPLTTMLLQLEVARREAATTASVPPLFSKFLVTTNRQLERLNRLVDHLLDVTKIQDGRLVIERTEFDLSALITEVL